MRTDPDYVALTVANAVVGGGPQGRCSGIFARTRDIPTASAAASRATRHRGSWSATTDVRTDVTDPALTDLLAEVATMRDTARTGASSTDAKRAIVAGFALSLESPPQLLGYYVQNWLYGLPADYWDTYPAKINAVTAAQAQAAAAKYWDGSKLQIVAVGDAGKITDILKKKGTLETFDAEGKPVK